VLPTQSACSVLKQPVSIVELGFLRFYTTTVLSVVPAEPTDPKDVEMTDPGVGTPRDVSMKRDMSMDTSSNEPSGSQKNRPSGAASEARENVGATFERVKSDIAEAANATGSDLAADMRNLRADAAKLQEALLSFTSEAGTHTARAARDVGSTVADRVGSVAGDVARSGADVAASATAQAKTFASELEGMARKNPLGTLACTLLVGVVIGMMTRGNRS
jgi:ElaB/YqjD/DUF883 family membrane-anchored ribosome-binding protein